MRVVHLSNHGADQLAAVKRQARQAEEARNQAEIAQLEAEAALQQARRSTSLLRKLLRWPSAEEKAARAALEAAQRQAIAAAAAGTSANIRTKQRASGERGEDRLCIELGERLDDEWTMFRGYMTKKGEADAALVGPRGVWLVEVKNPRARLYVDGDDWQYDKLSRRGFPQERRRAQDGGGRAWGRQAADAVEALQRWLTRKGISAPVYSAVVLMADGAEVASCRNPGVDLVGVGSAELLVAIRSRSRTIGPEDRRHLEQLIERDHEHSMNEREKRRRRRRAKNG